MKSKLKAPPKPSKEDLVRLGQCLWMVDWHFVKTIN